MNDTLVRIVNMECPMCDRVHDVELRKSIEIANIKGEDVECEEFYYKCSNCAEEESSFETGDMVNKNMLNAYDVYRRNHSLLTAKEIVSIREKYSLSQVDLARLLNWGEATISRYESKSIQDEAYDNMLRLIKDNPFIAYEFFKKNEKKFTPEKRAEIGKKICSNLEEYGEEYLKRQSLKSEYVIYDEPSDLNGYCQLDIDKVESMMAYMAETVNDLYKSKLMRLLWYADALSYKKFGKAISGLVYSYAGNTVIPVGHYKLLDLDCINAQEIEIGDMVKYIVSPNKTVEASSLNDEEKKIIDEAIKNFNENNIENLIRFIDEQGFSSDNVERIISYEDMKAALG